MIECRGVSFSYDGAVLALDGVDLNIEDGEFFCILGGNGSGKSTFAKHLNALLQPDAGTVRIDGMDASDPELVYDIRSTAGMVFQNPDDQLVATLVEDDVAFGPENLGVPSAQIAQRVREALKGVGLVGFERHETHALSGGQKQRVALAGVLAMEPRVLILDEASSMLDPRGRKGLMKACHVLHERGMTIVMITHFMEEAAEADRVAVFRAGRVAMLGTPEEILTRADELRSSTWICRRRAVWVGYFVRRAYPFAHRCVRRIWSPRLRRLMPSEVEQASRGSLPYPSWKSLTALFRQTTKTTRRSPSSSYPMFRTVIRSVRASAAAGISARPLRANRTNKPFGETTLAARGRCAMYR